MIFAASIVAALSAQPAPVVHDDVAPILVRREPTLRRRHGVWYRVRNKPKPVVHRAAAPVPEPEPRPVIEITPRAARTIVVDRDGTVVEPFADRWPDVDMPFFFPGWSWAIIGETGK